MALVEYHEETYADMLTDFYDLAEYYAGIVQENFTLQSRIPRVGQDYKEPVAHFPEGNERL